MSDIVKQIGLVSFEDKCSLMKQRPITFWITGLSGSGKSTLAYSLEKALFDLGKHAFVLDGDNIRHGLSENLGFSAEDRSENLRRVAEVAKLMNNAGLIVIVALISPFKADRSSAKSIVGDKFFVEVYLNTPLDICELRDPKQLYKKARTGKIKEFTGISAKYEIPLEPDVILDTSKQTIENCVNALLAKVL